MLQILFSADRLEGAIVRVGCDSSRENPICGTISLKQINANQMVHVTCDIFGNYLSIELPADSDILSLCEVRAYKGQCLGRL